MMRQDPEVFIRKTLENAVDADDLSTAIRMTRLIDDMMLHLNGQVETAQGGMQADANIGKIC